MCTEDVDQLSLWHGNKEKTDNKRTKKTNNVLKNLKIFASNSASSTVFTDHSNVFNYRSPKQKYFLMRLVICLPLDNFNMHLKLRSYGAVYMHEHRLSSKAEVTYSNLPITWSKFIISTSSNATHSLLSSRTQSEPCGCKCYQLHVIISNTHKQLF